MNIFFEDPNEPRLPPEEIRLKAVKVSPQPGGRLVKVQIELTPFLKRPNVDVTIKSTPGEEVAHTSIVETMLPKLEFTMHLRQPVPGSQYSIETKVYYQAMPEPTDEPVEIPLPEPLIVDRDEQTFIFQEYGS